MADDKFIMIGIDDEGSKDIAEVLGNKTCKKIIDYLADTKEASEKDISSALNMPINTVEYNLNKLIKSGLVVKSKNFFWSIKGKKIDMYKLANKHIIISPKKRPNLETLKSIIPILAIIFIIGLIAIFALPKNNPININGNNSELKSFSSYEEIKSFLKANTIENNYNTFNSADDRAIAPSVATGSGSAKGLTSAESASQSADSYSSTNIQVSGVDEADIVKNDGKYIYTISNNKIIIIDAYPASEMRILKEINITNPRDLFINNNKLIIFSEDYNNVPYTRCMGIRCGGRSEITTNVYIYNLENHENPILESNLSFQGSYLSSRMIGDYVYLISSKYAYSDNSDPIIYYNNGIEKTVPAGDVYYYNNPEQSYVFNSISAINLNDNSVNTKVYLMGGTGVVYVSNNNVYLTYTKPFDYSETPKMFADKVVLVLLPDKQDEVSIILKNNQGYYDQMNELKKIIIDHSLNLNGKEKEDFDSTFNKLLNDFENDINNIKEKSVIHKISLSKSNIEYKISGEINGNILNQFSIDEYEGNLRIATTTGQVWNGNSLNNLFILDDKLKVIGQLEDLAKGEKIYSVRFQGKKAYIVTFKKVDPLFVIDLSRPSNPKVLGELKIPGYSDYLHFYDENHIIGFGKDAVDAPNEPDVMQDNNFALYQGLKISMFDVTDVSNPIEEYHFIIGDRGSDSPILYDHKALLFDKEKNLLVIPVLVTQVNRSYGNEACDEYSTSCKTSAWSYGEPVFSGAYVFNINTTNIELKSKITHFNSSDNLYDYRYQIKRSIYMDDYLYTISDSKVKANDLRNYNEISSVEWGSFENYYNTYVK